MKQGEGKLGLVAIRLYDRCFICSGTLSFDCFAHLSQHSGRQAAFCFTKTFSVVLSRRGLTDLN